MSNLSDVPASALVIDSKKSSRLNPEIILNITGEGNQLVLGEKSRIAINRLDITGNNNRVIIGDNVSYKRGHIRISGNNQTIIIGSQTTLERCNMICAEGCDITIGEDCMISYDVVLRTTDGHSILDYETRKRINVAAGVVVGNHVWIGAGTIIGKGVCIPNDCIIGARSFVNRSLEQEHAIIAGSPAKVVKVGVTWDRERVVD